jgi:hypothetical protein
MSIIIITIIYTFIRLESFKSRITLHKENENLWILAWTHSRYRQTTTIRHVCRVFVTPQQTQSLKNYHAVPTLILAFKATCSFPTHKNHKSFEPFRLSVQRSPCSDVVWRPATPADCTSSDPFPSIRLTWYEGSIYLTSRKDPIWTIFAAGRNLVLTF